MTRAAIDRSTDVGTDLIERAFDPARDFPAVVELIGDVDRFDEVPYFPNVAALEVDWAPAPTFDPPNDLRLIFDADRLVAAGGHDWRERDGKVTTRSSSGSGRTLGGADSGRGCWPGQRHVRAKPLPRAMGAHGSCATA